MIGSILLAVVTTALFIYAQWCSSARRRLGFYERSATSFYAHLKPLIDDGDTPVAVLALLAFLNREITDRKAASRALAALAFFKRNGREEMNAEARKRSDEVSAFFEKRPELGRAFAHAASDCLLAISYTAPFGGSRIRKFLEEADVEKSSEASGYFVFKFERSTHERECGVLNGHIADC